MAALVEGISVNAGTCCGCQFGENVMIFKSYGVVTGGGLLAGV
jgi:hypothetical protein